MTTKLFSATLFSSNVVPSLRTFPWWISICCAAGYTSAPWADSIFFLTSATWRNVISFSYTENFRNKCKIKEYTNKTAAPWKQWACNNSTKPCPNHLWCGEVPILVVVGKSGLTTSQGGQKTEIEKLNFFSLSHIIRYCC